MVVVVVVVPVVVAVVVVAVAIRLAVLRIASSANAAVDPIAGCYSLQTLVGVTGPKDYSVSLAIYSVSLVASLFKSPSSSMAPDPRSA